jgi:hypothetical protein
MDIRGTQVTTVIVMMIWVATTYIMSRSVTNSASSIWS